MHLTILWMPLLTGVRAPEISSSNSLSGTNRPGGSEQIKDGDHFINLVGLSQRRKMRQPCGRPERARVHAVSRAEATQQESTGTGTADRLSGKFLISLGVGLSGKLFGRAGTVSGPALQQRRVSWNLGRRLEDPGRGLCQPRQIGGAVVTL